jgi:hypothetical protein
MLSWAARASSFGKSANGSPGGGGSCGGQFLGARDQNVESLRSSSTAQSWVSSARLFRASAIFAATTGFDRFSARSWVGLTDEALLDLVHGLVLAVAVDPPSQQSSRRTSS